MSSPHRYFEIFFLSFKAQIDRAPPEERKDTAMVTIP